MSESNLIELRFRSEDAVESRLVLTKASITAEHVSMPSDIACEYVVSDRENYLALHDIMLNDGELLTNTHSTIAETDLRGKITFIPAGMSVRGWGDPKVRRNSFTAIHFGADAIPEPLTHASVWQRERVYFTDARLGATLAKLDRALRSDEPFAGLLGETLCDLAIVELASSLRICAASSQVNATLRQNDIRRVQDYIAAHLAEDISLSDLASVVGLSKFYFCRAYKATTGRSPYHAILAMRIETARAALIGGMPIQKAAAQTGFMNMSQFSRTFRQFSGVSPSVFAKHAP